MKSRGASALSKSVAPLGLSSHTDVATRDSRYGGAVLCFRCRDVSEFPDMAYANPRAFHFAFGDDSGNP